LSDETATDDPAAAPRRLPAKLWLVGGAAALLSALIGGTVAWLLMATRAKPLRTPAASVAAAASAATKSASAAEAAPAETAAAAAASAAEAPAAPRAATAAPVVVPADASSGPVDGEPGAAQVAAAGAESTAAGAASTASVAPRLPAVAAGPDRSPNAAPVPLPLERLRLRLDEVLAGRGRVAAGEGGELRVVSANSALAAPAAGRAATAGPDPAPTPAHAGHPHWHYGDGPGGPRQWGRLNPEYAACAGGRRQSPIDIRDGLALDLEPLRFDYRPGAFSVLDNGHTVQVDVASGSGLVAGGRRYALQQFHFHRPSEERIDGRRFDMDVHLVHRDEEGRLAVVAVLLERGAPLPVMQTVWNHLPLERNEASAPTATLDPAELLPADRRYYTYMGSLTTPPCSEGVLWFVLQQPVDVADRQIDIFARLYPMNARPLQAGAGRLIKQSN
jgi:carbonic anhydrase